ncbi:amidophosphoribosyltransferase [Patescibacteria group bacterium]|nr:amidophosphoribosyltransferase [Patescibacteria group bacterium]
MCGIFGAVSNKDVAREIRHGLWDLQHRGEQGSGMALSNGQDHWIHKGRGLVTEVFPDEVIEGAKGYSGIGYDRYSTVGDITEKEMSVNIQPFIGEFHGESFAVAHNGNLIDLEPLQREAENGGYSFKTTSDTEVIVGLLSVSQKNDFIEALLEILPKLKGAFSLVILYKDKVIGVLDRFGIRPLCLGRNDSSYILASESCAFHTIQGRLLDDIQPGEMIVLDKNGINDQLGPRPFIWAEDPQLKFCIFELVYFARPESIIHGKSVYSYRVKAGEILAKEHPIDADIVIGVPASGEIYDIGFSQESEIPLERGIGRNRYFTTKTFLTRRGTDRAALQRIKFHPLKSVVHGKRLVVTEDSVIRSKVAPEIVAMLREEGATEVHLRVGSSPICYTCYLGIDMASRGELIAASLPVEGVRKYIQADTLGYLSQEGMIKASGFKKENLAMGCFTGVYPVELN